MPHAANSYFMDTIIIIDEKNKFMHIAIVVYRAFYTEISSLSQKTLILTETNS